MNHEVGSRRDTVFPTQEENTSFSEVQNRNFLVVVKTLEKKSFKLWKEELDVSVHDEFEKDNELKIRIFKYKDIPLLSRVIPY